MRANRWMLSFSRSGPPSLRLGATHERKRLAREEA
jgi:hypothetical protein